MDKLLQDMIYLKYLFFTGSEEEKEELQEIANI